MEVTDSSPPKPVPELLFLKKEAFVEIARPEHVGVEDPVDELGRVVGAPANEAHDDNTVGRGRVCGGGKRKGLGGWIGSGFGGGCRRWAD